MRFGVRLQLLFALGSALLLAFIPLFYAVATYTKIALYELQRDNARAMGRAVAGQILEASAHRPVTELGNVLVAQVGTSGVAAVAIYDENRALVGGAGEMRTLDELVQELNLGREHLVQTSARHGSAIVVSVPAGSGAIMTLVRTDAGATRFVPLARMLALYMGLVALVLLLVTYFLLTNMLVRPLDALSQAATRVADGARRLEVPRTSVRELIQLGASLETMTAHLISEEQALRRKVDEVEQATAELAQAQAHLVRSERLASVGRLSAGLAHEVGNPIAAIIGMQDLLLDADLDPEQQRDFLRRMRKETDRVNRIMRDLLQFARPKGGAAEDVDPGSVEVALHDTVALVSPQKSLEDVDLSLDVYPDLPPVPLGREQLIQILLNLVLNAADACGRGGRVALRARPHGDGVRITVEDTGTGVPEDVADQLFEPFFTTKEVGKGTGLGLSVCKGLVEAAGGSIQLDSSYHGGARFIVDLPAAPDIDA